MSDLENKPILKAADGVMEVIDGYYNLRDQDRFENLMNSAVCAEHTLFPDYIDVSLIDDLTMYVYKNLNLACQMQGIVNAVVRRQEEDKALNKNVISLN